MNIQLLDQKARQLAENYIQLEKELLEVIAEMDRLKVFFKLGYPSLFEYVTKALRLSPAQAYSFINVARKTNEIPELKKEVEQGLSVSKAHKMTSVLTKDNHKRWFVLARSKTYKELEREVAIANPKSSVPEKEKFLPMDVQSKERVTIKTSIPRIELQMGVSEELMLKFRHAQDLESQRQRKSVSLEETLYAILELYMDKKDPVRKAKRHMQKRRGKLEQDALEKRNPFFSA